MVTYEDRASLQLVYELALSEPITDLYVTYSGKSHNNEHILQKLRIVLSFMANKLT